MIASLLSRFQDARRRPLGRRVFALLLALIIHVLLIGMLLTLAPEIIAPRKDQRFPVSFTLAPAPSPKAAADTKKPVKKPQASGGAPKVVTHESPQPKKAQAQPTPELPFIQLTREDLASGDIGKIAKRGDGGSGAGQGKNSGLAYGPGEGPGGEQLFNADWYRRPTNAELSTYMPANAPRTGYGLVACQTVERFHVENCRVLGEQPLGSGFGRAVRLAAWQFLVRPPSINGRPQVGAWVRIQINYVEGVAQ